MALSTYPALALPEPLVLLPSCRLTLPVDRSTGLALLDLLAEPEPALVAVPAVRTPGARPGSYQLHNWGTAARILRLIKRPSSKHAEQPYLLTLEAVSPERLQLTRPPPLASPTPGKLIEVQTVHPAPGNPPAKEYVEAFRSAALTLLDRMARDAQQPGKQDMSRRLMGMLEDMSNQRVIWLADLLVSTLISDYNDKLEFLSLANTEERIRRATHLFIKQTSISEISRKIESEVNESLSKQQKEFYLRQQLAAIQKELHQLNRQSGGDGSQTPSSAPVSELDNDDQHDVEDMAELKAKIEAMETGSEERKMCVQEWRRMKRIQPSSVEHGVIRSYLEWVTALPWPSSSPPPEALDALRDPAFLSKAKAQLDADHFGLEKIKRRLIEYLAVMRLKNLALEAEQGRLDALPAPRDIAGAKMEGTATGPGDDGKQVVVYKKPLPATSTGQTPSRRRRVKGPILLFVGPPGVGKTSLGQSVAKALNRPFQRVSLGGVRDEAEIRGHRRTYVASGPGIIVQALRKAGRLDPVILLDEIDKIGQSNFHGDPAAALLEVLDPEQNHSFKDHYINIPVDLSQVLFICTSNTLETISPPLRDRCEIIQLSGYTYDEKLHIARNFILSKQLEVNGMGMEQVIITDGALAHTIRSYTSEAGVRSLERAVGSIIRAKVVELANSHDANSKTSGLDAAYNPHVEESDVERILGVPWTHKEELERDERKGLVYGLVVSGLGEGDVMPVETSMVPGTGKLILTGSLGDVIKESGEIALSWVKSHAYRLGITTSPSQDVLKFPNVIDVHLHLPAGAQKKDGPSAGVAMTCAFVSLLTGLCIPPNIAMTGEVTLRGRVTPVGGIKEKVLGAHRAGVTRVILPVVNRKDVVHDIPAEVQQSMQIVFVRTVEEALEAAFGKGKLMWRTPATVFESHL